MRTVSGTHRIAALIVALALGSLPLEANAQHFARAGVTRSDRAPTAHATLSISVDSRVAATAPARRSMRPFLLGGALVGAVVGGMLAVSFNDSFCGEPAPGYSCTSTSPVAGALIGAGVGVAAGWLLWAFTSPREPSS